MARDVSPLTAGFSKLGYTLGALPAIRRKLETDRVEDEAGIESTLALRDTRLAEAALKESQLNRALEIVRNMESPDFKAPPGFVQTANPFADSQAEAALAFQRLGDAETQRRLIAGEDENMDVDRAMALLNASGVFSESGGRVLNRYSGGLDESGKQAGANVRATEALTGSRTRSNTPKGGRPRSLTGPQLKLFEVITGKDRFTGRPVFGIDTERLTRFRRWMADQELADEPAALNQWLLEGEPDGGALATGLEQLGPITEPPVDAGAVPQFGGEPAAEDPYAGDAEGGDEPAQGADTARVMNAIARARAAGRDDLADRIEAEARAEGIIP
jgi:hypothetical protein